MKSEPSPPSLSYVKEVFDFNFMKICPSSLHAKAVGNRDPDANDLDQPPPGAPKPARGLLG